MPWHSLSLSYSASMSYEAPGSLRPSFEAFMLQSCSQCCIQDPEARLVCSPRASGAAERAQHGWAGRLHDS